ncbi:hypothetical protein Pfo_020590 [Paulownia fortunei]|nr:hypothetical protein Pfo_020590 [Paulownia fortunei]
MADWQKSDSSLVELAIERELANRKKVPCSKNEVVKILRRAPSFSDWTDTGSVQSSVELPSLPSSSPRPQNWMGQSSIKNEPYTGELSGHRSLTSASNDWIGPSKLLDETHYSSYEVPPLVPFSSENPILHTKVPALRPSPKLDLFPRTNMVPLEHLNQVQKPNSYPRPSVPTKPRSGLKRKATDSEQRLPCRNPSPSTSSSNMTKKSVENLLCELCQVSCSSALTMQQHLNGRPHKAKLEWMQLKSRFTGDRKGKPRCDVCQIWCTDGDGLDMHLKGKKHKAKLQELELVKKNGGGIIAKKPILCELCLVHSMNEELFKMHLKGRPHAAREELKRRGML